MLLWVSFTITPWFLSAIISSGLKDLPGSGASAGSRELAIRQADFYCNGDEGDPHNGNKSSEMWANFHPYSSISSSCGSAVVEMLLWGLQQPQEQFPPQLPAPSISLIFYFTVTAATAATATANTGHHPPHQHPWSVQTHMDTHDSRRNPGSPSTLM